MSALTQRPTRPMAHKHGQDDRHGMARFIHEGDVVDGVWEEIKPDQYSIYFSRQDGSKGIVNFPITQRPKVWRALLELGYTIHGCRQIEA